MSKNNKFISVQETTWLDISVPPEMKEEFKQMVRRSIGTWQDASPEMRRFVDRLLGQEDIMKSTYDTGRGKLKENEIVQVIKSEPPQV